MSGWNGIPILSAFGHKDDDTITVNRTEWEAMLEAKKKYSDQLKAERENAINRCIDIGGFYADGAECKRLMTEQMLALLSTDESKTS